MEFKNKVTVALIALSLAGTAEAMPPKGKNKGGGAASKTPTKPKPATAAPAPATPKTPKSPTLKERFAALPADVQATLEPQIKALQASYSVGDADAQIADLLTAAERDVVKAAFTAVISSASKRSSSAGSRSTGSGRSVSLVAVSAPEAKKLAMVPDDATVGTGAPVVAPAPEPAAASGDATVDTAASTPAPTPAPVVALDTLDTEVHVEESASASEAKKPAMVPGDATVDTASAPVEAVTSHHRAPTAATAAALDAANVTNFVPKIEEKIAAQIRARRTSVTAETSAAPAPTPAPAPVAVSADATGDTVVPAPTPAPAAEEPVAKPSYAAVAAGTHHADGSAAEAQAPAAASSDATVDTAPAPVAAVDATGDAAAPVVAQAPAASSETAVDKAAEQLKAWANEFPIHSSDISASAQARRTPAEALMTANRAVGQAYAAGKRGVELKSLRAELKAAQKRVKAEVKNEAQEEKKRVRAEIKAQRAVNAAVHAENRKEARARFEAMDAPATAAHFKALAEARKAAETATDQEKELYEKYVAAFSGSNGPARILMPGEEPVSASKKAGELPALDEAMAKKLVENATLPSKDKEDEAAQLGALFGSVSESDFVTPDQNTTAQAWYTSFGSKVVNNPGISGVTMGAVFAAGFTGQAAYNFWQLAARSGKKASFGDFVTYFRGELTKKLSAQQVETYLKAGAVLFPAAGGAVALFNHFQK